MGNMAGARGRQRLRRPANVSLPTALLAEAKQLGINVSEACEAGLSQRVAQMRRERWLQENHEAIDSYNARIEKDGLTLARYRQF
jgi:antitoxin CcdA